MKQYGASRKRPSLLSLIFNAARARLAGQRQLRSFAHARKRLDHDDPAPMERIARTSVGDAWVALADYYANHRPEDAALVTEAYRNAAQSKYWFCRNPRAEEEYDRRRLLGIGTESNIQALAREWENQHLPGYGREMQLAWIYACGPDDLRDFKEAWWWVAMAEARWGRCKDVDLPTLSAIELRQHLMRRVSEIDRHLLQAKAKTCAYEEFRYHR